jgi:hypothetical protein
MKYVSYTDEKILSIKLLNLVMKIFDARKHNKLTKII